MSSFARAFTANYAVVNTWLDESLVISNRISRLSESEILAMADEVKSFIHRVNSFKVEKPNSYIIYKDKCDIIDRNISRAIEVLGGAC